MRRTPRSRNRRGSAAVEFALVAPLLFMALFGVVEIGRLMMVENIFTGAALEGARVASVADSSQAVTSVVQNYLAARGVDADVVTVTLDPTDISTAEKGDEITVTLTAGYGDFTWISIPGAVSVSNMESVATVSRE